jgi:hypothetical protein
MTDTKKKKNPRAVSPAGLFLFPKLRTPDTKFNKDGLFSVDLVLEPAEAEVFIKSLQRDHDLAIAEGQTQYAGLKPAFKANHPFQANPFYVLEYDDKEQPTGRIIVKFKATAVFTVKGKNGEAERVNRTIAVYDSRGNVLPPSVDVWSGSMGRVAFSYFPYFVSGTGAAGLSLRLESVRVLKLMTRGAADPFGAPEDGFEYHAAANDNDDRAADTTPDYRTDGEQGGDDEDDARSLY